MQNVAHQQTGPAARRGRGGSGSAAAASIATRPARQRGRCGSAAETAAQTLRQRRTYSDTPAAGAGCNIDGATRYIWRRLRRRTGDGALRTSREPAAGAMNRQRGGQSSDSEDCGVDALLDWHNLLSCVTRLYERDDDNTVGWVEGSGLR